MQADDNRRPLVFRVIEALLFAILIGLVVDSYRPIVESIWRHWNKT